MNTALRKIKKLFVNPYYYILDKISHEKYAEKLGVNMGKVAAFTERFRGEQSRGLSPLETMFM